MPGIYSSIACNLDADILSASLPLLEEERVEAIEWSFDTLFKTPEIPAWFLELLQTYSEAGRLIGHGIFFSLFSGRWSPGQQSWLEALKHMSARFHFDHITEHFGFMTGRDFHHGAPLNIPYSATTLAIGRDRLARIHDACGCPVGLENLAFSYSPEEVKRHGEFLDKLIEPVNGFIILDLHNLYCQIHNFSIAFEDIIGLYPLERVREIHISGGSWEPSMTGAGKKIRRDTHDDSVPDDVFRLLELTMKRCPNLKYVVMEQLGNGLKTEKSRKLFYSDFGKMESMVRMHGKGGPTELLNDFMPLHPLSLNGIAEDETLYRQQLELSDILETSSTCEEAERRLKTSSLAASDWQIEQWDPCMLETAIRIAEKWKK